MQKIKPSSSLPNIFVFDKIIYHIKGQQGGVAHVQKDKSKNLIPSKSLHKIIYKICKRQISTFIESLTPTIQNPQQIKLKIMQG